MRDLPLLAVSTYSRFRGVSPHDDQSRVDHGDADGRGVRAATGTLTIESDNSI